MLGAQITVLNGIVIMKKIKMIVELEYEDSLEGNDQDEKDCFIDFVLKGKDAEEINLILHSNYLGEEIGVINVLEILDDIQK